LDLEINWEILVVFLFVHYIMVRKGKLLEFLS
jgi:hypothetical protein